MAKWKKLAEKIFAGTNDEESVSGLSVQVGELLALKKKTSYLKGFRTHKTQGVLAGDVKSAFKGRGMEMEEIRAYNFGDDVRDIDWRVSARRQQPYTKIYNEERDREVMIVLDMSSPMVFGTRKELKSVSAAKAAALIGWRALENKDRVGAVIFREKEISVFKPDNRSSIFASLCRKIAEVSRVVLEDKIYHDVSLKKALKQTGQNLHGRAVIFIISDFSVFNEEVQQMLSVLSAKNKLYLVHVIDVLEQEAPPAGEYMVENGGEKLLFNTSEKNFRETYHRYFSKKRHNVEDFCHRSNNVYIEVLTNRPLEEQLKI